MSLKAYKFKDFDTTHENKFFRLITQELKQAFANHRTCFLLGNLSCAGRCIDAVFLASGKIIVLEFKNYGGNLIFSENGPWRIMPPDNLKMLFVEVQGGGKEGRNPLGQVRTYRYAMKDVLSANRDAIRENDSLLNFGHIAGLVVFHSKVEVENPGAIHESIKCWFDIADGTNYVDKINDQNSNALTLTDNEVENIAKILGVNEAVLEFQPDDETDLINSAPVAESLILTDRALEEFGRISQTDSPQEAKMLDYFRASTFLERLREDLKSANKKKGDNGGKYLFNPKSNHDKTLLSITLSENEGFFKEYLLQKDEAHFGKPQLLFVGIQLQIGTGDNAFSDALLYKTITLGDKTKNNPSVDIACEELELYRYPLAQRELSAALLDEMEAEVNSCFTLEEKADVLSRSLEIPVAVENKIVVSFIEETPYTKGLESELRKLAQKGADGSITISQSKLATCFLRRVEYKYLFEKTINKEDLVFVTDTNEEQKKAVECGFKQAITIVTGPPGTGKTQIITNIMANAVLQNQTVLLASRNGTAVESAITRISSVLNEKDFLLYFNKKQGNPQSEGVQHIYYKSKNNGFTYDTKTLAQMRERIQGKSGSRKNLAQIKNTIEALKDSETNQQIAAEHSEEKHKAYLCNNKALLDLLDQHHDKLDEVVTLLQCEQLYIQRYQFMPSWLFKHSLEPRRIRLLESSLTTLLSERDQQQLGIQGNAKTKRLNIWVSENLTCTKLSQQIHQEAKTLEAVLRMHTEKAMRLREQISVLKQEAEKMGEQLGELETVEFGKQYLNLTITEKLNRADQKVLFAAINMLKNNAYSLNSSDSLNQAKDMLAIFNIVATKTLSVRNAFPLTPELFDILIFDEASQCDFISALPLLFRAKRIIIIGDPFQLKHITSIKPHEERYIKRKLELTENISHVTQSLFDYCEQFSSICNIRHNVFLAKHYRCHKDIIGYSSKEFYEKRAGQALQVLTNDAEKTHGVFWENVNTGMHNNEENTNSAEVTKIKSLVENYLANTKYSIGVTTPFRGQADAIKKVIEPSARVQIGTVHAFQGAEQDVMILSLVCTSNSSPHKVEWINQSVPYLLNVAVTRAKNILHIVGDLEYLRRSEQNMPLHQLVRYVDDLAHRKSSPLATQQGR